MPYSTQDDTLKQNVFLEILKTNFWKQKQKPFSNRKQVLKKFSEIYSELKAIYTWFLSGALRKNGYLSKNLS